MKLGMTFLLLLLAITACEKKATSAKNAAAPTQSAVPTPRERLDASIKAYREAKSYRDEGTAVAMRDGVAMNTLPFSTVFERGGRFKFEFHFARDPATGIASVNEPNVTCTVWSPDGKTFMFREVPGEPPFEDAASTQVARATGISWGTASMILPLLVGCSAPIETLSDLKVAGSESIDGVECHMIAGATKLPGYTMTLWIDSAALIQRVRHEIEIDFSNSRAFVGKPVPPKSIQHTIITFKPVLNEDAIDATRFKVN